ncbi:hypothetical protein SAMN02745130_00474 [Thiothrix eikelboomii]|uniref:EF-hand domain-containing protein n=1 Tax=Thiothrix eikelboomii TaxID=92487 RepID=A0A1T4VWT0_9GAMM|nr:hypothetical protein [Thiothrix eikelboomii]SKA69462.1 hypothetical protein SAMN02745130_00474 [Thiothrix eikelboomii]
MLSILSRVRQPKPCLVFGWLSLATLISTPVYAHAGHNELIQLRVNNQQLGVDMSLNLADLMRFDRNQDGQLTRQEFVEQQTSIKQWLQTQIQLKTKQANLKPTWFDLPLEVDAKNLSVIKHIRLIQRYDLPVKQAVKFQSQLPSFKGKSLMFASDEQFYMTNLTTNAVEVLVQAGTTE